MKRQSVWMIGLVLSMLVASPAVASPDDPGDSPVANPTDSPTDANEPRNKAPNVDLVIALDTSGSMEGLIDSTRQKLWDIVNDLALAKPRPNLRVGLISFGNDSYHEPGWTRVDVNLTSDLDAVYEKLMALRTNGGTEYVGRAIHTARSRIEWSQDRKALKMLFVAGNESADQDREYPAQTEATQAQRQGIVVNAIYCGHERDSVAVGWRRVAAHAKGQFANIDQRAAAQVQIDTPVDDRLRNLNDKLNKTYIPYGQRGKTAIKRQAKIDEQTKKMSNSAAASRAGAKASGLYRNDDWDLVDALDSNKVDVAEMKDEALPEEMQKLDSKGRERYVRKKAEERKRIQKEIQNLNAQRETYIKKEKKKQARKNKGKPAPKAMDKAVKSTIRKQAMDAGMAW